MSEDVPAEWWVLSAIAGFAPMLAVGFVSIAQEAVSEVTRREYEEKQDILAHLPKWFPLWLYEQSTPEELREYISVIYWGGLAKEDIAEIPGRVYHVTPNPEMIMREGFKTAAELGITGFGGTGDYISTTTPDNARIYLTNMRMACRVVNGAADLRELKTWMMEQAEGSDEPFERSFKQAKHPLVYGRPPDPEMERLGLDYPPFNTPEFLWEVFEKGDVMDGPGFVLFVGKPTLLRKRCEDIKIVEAEPSPRLRFRHHYNVFRDTPMMGRYTYNQYETQWRIWDSTDLKPLRILSPNIKFDTMSIKTTLQVGDEVTVKLVWAPIPKGWRKDRPPPPELIGYAPDGFQVWFPREKIIKFKEGDVVKATIRNLHPPEDPILYLADVEAV